MVEKIEHICGNSIGDMNNEFHVDISRLALDRTPGVSGILRVKMTRNSLKNALNPVSQLWMS